MFNPLALSTRWWFAELDCTMIVWHAWLSHYWNFCLIFAAVRRPQFWFVWTGQVLSRAGFDVGDIGLINCIGGISVSVAGTCAVQCRFFQLDAS